jgi:hypothetical protein
MCRFRNVGCDLGADGQQHAGFIPPDRMIAHLDTLEERTAHILAPMEWQEERDRSYVWQHRECRTHTESGSWSRAGLIS